MTRLDEYPSEKLLALVRELLQIMGFHYSLPDDPVMRMSLELGRYDLSKMRRNCFGVIRRHYPNNTSREELEAGIWELERYQDGIVVVHRGEGQDPLDLLRGGGYQYYEDLNDDHPLKPLLDIVLKAPIEMLKARLAALIGEEM